MSGFYDLNSIKNEFVKHYKNIYNSDQKNIFSFYHENIPRVKEKVL